MPSARRSPLFHRVVLALPILMLGYLGASGRLASYWRAFASFGQRAAGRPSAPEFGTAVLWLVAVTPLVLAAWEIGNDHTAARRLNYTMFVGLREVVRRALGRQPDATAQAREATFAQLPRDRPLVALALGVLVTIAVPVFLASCMADLRAGPALGWLGVTGVLFGGATYCRRRAMAYLQDEPRRWDVFREWRLLSPARYDARGRVFVHWQIAIMVTLPVWWVGVGLALLFHP